MPMGCRRSALRVHHERPGKNHKTTNNAVAACSDGMAATGFNTATPRSKVLETVSRFNSDQPRPVMRSIFSMYPFFAAIHGGAAG